MSLEFDKAFERTVGLEGGYVNDPHDRGGETKYGISKRSYPKLDIKNLSLYEAKRIYYKDFWATDKMNLDIIPTKISLELFDTGVNLGIHKARKMLQRALNLLNRVETRYEDLTVDGWIGELSLKAIAKTDTNELLKTLNGLQFLVYYDIVERDHTQERFFAGWVKRT